MRLLLDADSKLRLQKCGRYRSDIIIRLPEPAIIVDMSLWHPRVPSLAMAALIIARCLYISHLCGPSGFPVIIVVILDKSSPAHDIIFAFAGL